MPTLCTPSDVEARLRRPLTPDETQWLPGMIQEAQTLVLSYLGCPPDKYSQDIPAALTLITSRIVARVIQENDTIEPATFAATQFNSTAGPFSQQATFTQGSRTGAPWLTRADKNVLDQHRCAGKAYAIDTAPHPPQYTTEQARHILRNSNRGWTH